MNKIYSGIQRVCRDFDKLHKKFIYNNASEMFILSNLGSLLQHVFSINYHKSGIFTPFFGSFWKN